MLQQDLSKAEMKRPAGLAHHPVKKYLRRIGNESEVPDFPYCEVSVELGESQFGRTIASFSRLTTHRYHSLPYFACHGCGIFPS
jgi:hypothetical protein